MRTTQVVKGLELMPGLSKAPSELRAILFHIQRLTTPFELVSPDYRILH